AHYLRLLLALVSVEPFPRPDRAPPSAARHEHPDNLPRSIRWLRRAWPISLSIHRDASRPALKPPTHRPRPRGRRQPRHAATIVRRIPTPRHPTDGATPPPKCLHSTSPPGRWPRPSRTRPETTSAEARRQG